MATDIQEALFYADDMTLEDIPAVMSIEKASFPVPWPEQAYRHEILENPNGYFIVARLRQPGDAVGAMQRPGSRNLLGRLVSRQARPSPPRPIIGFAGMWMFVDEGHISTIASRRDWRGRGIGELLLV
ncbi:MAG: GNAT family N-acetyltransferase, partial [Chloroflexi bacterium]|nr:GNAT family N-acetyltransferase [Chloroflexota bacterium]